jgi:L-ascorbate metabolism protein UlaG (beta-lactamase superfamily)
VAARGARLLRFQRIESVYELDWGESLAISGYTIHCVPALHFSARGILDRNKTLWCGYVIEYPESLVYFAGDTGFGSHFDQIREKFGSPQLALLPIGAYEPRWFISPVHMSPEEAVRAHTILGAKTSIAIHHGAFQLADDVLTAARLMRGNYRHGLDLNKKFWAEQSWNLYGSASRRIFDVNVFVANFPEFRHTCDRSMNTVQFDNVVEASSSSLNCGL